MTRQFQATKAKRTKVALWLGLMGPSGGGKTFSSQRLAKGMAAVTGGKVFCVDTETRRSLFYSDLFDFQHIDMGPPFGSLDYLEAITFCVKQGASVVIIDSMSHEHEGPDGYLDAHDKELTRLCRGDDSKRGQMNFLAWAKPAQNRAQMIQGLLRLNCNFIFCFRAKEKLKLIKQPNGKTEPTEIGWMPIAGDALLYEMTMNCLLPPRANGVPQWESEYSGEKLMMKLPEQFRSLFGAGQPLDEKMGAELAKWAAGGQQAPQTKQPEPALIRSEFQDAHKMVLAACGVSKAAFDAAWRRLSKEEKIGLTDAVMKIYKPTVEKTEGNRVTAS